MMGKAAASGSEAEALRMKAEIERARAGALAPGGADAQRTKDLQEASLRAARSHC